MVKRTDRITIDFETRSAADLKACGAFVYSKDPSTDVLCLAYKIPGKELNLWTPIFPDLYETDCPSDLKEAIESGLLVEAHNAEFEQVIWKNVLERRYLWPEVPFERWRCSAAKAAALALPRKLEQVAKALKLSIEKDMAGNRLMLKLSKPRRPLKAEMQYLQKQGLIKIIKNSKTLVYQDGRQEHLWHEKEEEFERLFAYCEKDVLTEEAVSETCRDLSEDELRVWQLDQKINQRGIRCDVNSIKIALDFIARYEAELLTRLQCVTKDEIQTTGQIDKIKNYCKSKGVFMSGLDKATLEETLERDDLPEDVRTVLEIRKALAKSSTKKFKKMLDMADRDDYRIRGTLLYHGATTGRWAGRGIQPQNFPRGEIKDVEDCIELLRQGDYKAFRAKYPNVLSAISSCLRGMLMADEGNDLLCADFSAIEARVLFWLAGEEAGLAIYRSHGKIYEDMAATIYKKKIDAIEKGSFERQLGKQAVLGCGYGMGRHKFKETCQGYGMEVDNEVATLAVNTYRGKFQKVVQFWYATEDAAIRAIKRPGSVQSAGLIKWRKQGRFLYAKLPSGRLIAYYAPSTEMGKTPWGEPKEQMVFWGVDSKTKQFCKQRTYGGKLVENVTQAVARDFMTEAMLRIDEKYPIIMSVHDELVSEVKKGVGSLEEFEALMAERPSWGRNCPIEVEGWQGKRFKK